MAGLISKITPILNSMSTELKAVGAMGATAPVLWLLPASAASPVTHLVHLSALSFQFGMHMWVSSVGGSTMFFNMPRHMFGRVQSKLFPKYFLISSVTSLAALGTFAMMYPPNEWGGETQTKGILLACGLVGNLLNTLYLGPASTKVMWTCQAFEKSMNHGHEVGVTKFDMSGLEKKQLDKYAKVKSKFGMLHGCSVLVNLGVIVVHTFYFYLVAKQLAGVGPVTIPDL